MCDHDFNAYAVNHYNNSAFVTSTVSNVVIINNTNTYNNANFNAGPRREVVEAAIGHKMEPVTISETNKPSAPGHSMTGNNLSVYRPAISQATATGAAPSHIVPIERVKTVNEGAVHGILPHANNAATPASHQQTSPAQKQYEQVPSHPAQPSRPAVEERAPVQPSRPAIEERAPAQPARPAIEEHNQMQPAHTNNQNQNQPRPQPKPKPQSQPKPPARPGQPQRERK